MTFQMHRLQRLSLARVVKSSVENTVNVALMVPACEVSVAVSSPALVDDVVVRVSVVKALVGTVLVVRVAKVVAEVSVVALPDLSNKHNAKEDSTVLAVKRVFADVVRLTTNQNRHNRACQAMRTSSRPHPEPPTLGAMVVMAL